MTRVTRHKGLSDDEYEIDSLASIDSDEEKDGLPNNSRYPIHKLLRDMSEYKREIRTIFLTQDDFKEAIATYAVYDGRDLYFTYEWVSKRMEKKVRDNPKMTLKDIIEKTQQKWTVKGLYHYNFLMIVLRCSMYHYKKFDSNRY
ncbi:hypothetical protein G2W53_003455 [Senna tora]|uniref:Uncharacterized protein n=1 Tax=Senna tora TaxID=362788 RepID=A0A835CJA3_9FABA|nr:hypothetical protein G2W53_003455 [Senna tora]